MIELLGTVLGFAADMISLGLSIAFDAVEFVFGLLGGLLSLIFGLGGLVLVIALVCVFIKRRGKKKQTGVFVDENGEEFVSYYHQQEQ